MTALGPSQTALVPVDEVAERMHAAGLPVEVIAMTVGIAPSEVSRIVKARRFVPEDAELATETRRLSYKVLAEAFNILEHGHPNRKMEIVKIVLGRTAGLIGEETTTTYEETKEAISAIFTQQRTVTPHAVGFAASLSAADHSGQEAADDEDSIRSED